MTSGDGPTGKPPKEGDVVWISCRASDGCEGKQAKIVFMKKLPLVAGGGSVVRYKCETCGGAFHIPR